MANTSAERAKLDEAGRFMAAGNERVDELDKEGARDDSFQSILCDTYKGAVETCKAIISYIGGFILRAKGGERWPDVVAGMGRERSAMEPCTTDSGASSCLEAQRMSLRSL